MVKEFAQDYALILGGSSGLGLASAKKLATHGMGLFIVHRNTRAEMKAIETAFDEIKAIEAPFYAFNNDVLDKEKRTALITFAREHNIKFSCVLHSIAKGSLKAMVDIENDTLTEDDFQLTMQYMAYSLLDWVTALHKANVLADDTRIIAFTSEGGQKAWKHYGAVSAAKAALEAIIRNMALEFAPYGIKSNCIQAGVTITQSMQRIPGSDLLQDYTIKRNPFKRMTTPEDVANVVYLLCKKEAAWINGSIIPVDGGEHIT
jgi:enoyl-[acyl-carrier protein] reductase I